MTLDMNEHIRRRQLRLTERETRRLRERELGLNIGEENIEDLRERKKRKKKKKKVKRRERRKEENKTHVSLRVRA